MTEDEKNAKRATQSTTCRLKNETCDNLSATKDLGNFQIFFLAENKGIPTLLITITIREISSILCSWQDSQKGGRSDLSEPAKSSPSHPPSTTN